jgi:hypothetical protein
LGILPKRRPGLGSRNCARIGFDGARLAKSRQLGIYGRARTRFANSQIEGGLRFTGSPFYYLASFP